MARVLIVEDDVTISSAVSDTLQAEGYEVDTAENGAVGMAKVRESPPDMIVLDLMMPVMDGWEFMRQYREIPGCADTPVLVMSAAAQRSTLDLFGQFTFLAKPFDLYELLRAAARLSAQANSSR